MGYNAFYQDDHTEILFRQAPAEKVRALLPPGTQVCVDTRSTLGRTDGGDEYEFALFERAGRVIVVQRMLP